MTFETTMTVRAEVTADHIAQGKAKCSGHCPVALAVRAAVTDCNSLSVKQSAVVFEHPVLGKCFAELPPETEKFIEEFDRGKNVEPTSFYFRVHTNL